MNRLTSFLGWATTVIVITARRIRIHSLVLNPFVVCAGILLQRIRRIHHTHNFFSKLNLALLFTLLLTLR